MNDQSAALTAIMGEIHVVASRIGRDWPSVITAEDAEQEIMLRLLETNYATTVAQMDKAARNYTLYKIGQQIASQYRAEHDHFTGNFFYSVREVRALLKDGALGEKRDLTRTERLDLDEGMALLQRRSERYARLIGERYLYGEDPDGPTEQRATQRAVDALTMEMNRVHRNREARVYNNGGPGSRKPEPSEVAHSNTTADWQGDLGEGRR